MKEFLLDIFHDVFYDKNSIKNEKRKGLCGSI